MSKQIGEDIRALRKSRGMTLKELATAIGRSLGWLSQIERGQTTPSVRDLGLIAAQFDINISVFFRSASREEAEQGRVLRAEDRTAIGSSESGLTEELLSPSLSGSFEMMKSIFAPKAQSEGNRPGTEIEHGGMVLAGRIVLTIDGQEIALKAGDSFQFSASAYHWHNPYEAPCEVLWVVSPPVY